MKGFRLINTTCKKCGKKVMASPQSMSSKYGRICESCGLSDEEYHKMLKEQAKKYVGNVVL